MPVFKEEAIVFVKEEAIVFDAVRSIARPARRRIAAALFCAALVVPAALAAPARPAHAQTVVTYALPSGLPSAANGSGVCSVSVAGQSSGVYQYAPTGANNFSTIVGYTTFETDAAVQVQVTFTSSVSSAVVRPKSYGITPQITGNTVSFSMNPGQKVSVEPNGSTSTVCLVFADPVESNPPTQSTATILYEGPGVHNLGSSWCFPNGITELYLAGGAYVTGTINASNTGISPCNAPNGASIQGPGVFSGDGQSTQYWHVWLGGNASVTLQGPTFVASPRYAVQDYTTGQGNLVNDVKVITAGFEHNGLDMANNGTVENSFVLAGDDTISVEGSQNVSYQNIVEWSTGGDAIQFGWNYPGGNDTVDGVDVIHYTGGNFNNSEGVMGSMAWCNNSDTHDIAVRNVRVEGPLSSTRLFGFTVTNNNGYCQSGTTSGSIYNIHFANISAEQTPDYTSVLNGFNSNKTIHDMSFDNVTIAGTLLTPANSGAYLTMNQYVSNVTFGSSGSGGATVNDPALTYTGGGWGHFTSRAGFGAIDVGDDVHGTQANGDCASYAFTGTGVSFVTELDQSQGNVDVYLDNMGAKLTTVSEYTSGGRTTQQVPYNVDTLSSGPHTLKLCKASGQWMVIDALTVHTANDTVNDPALTYSGGGWGHFTSRAGFGAIDVGDDVHGTQANGDCASYAFTGTGVSFVTELDQSQGNVDVYLDNMGAKLTTVSEYTSGGRTTQQAPYNIDTLSSGPHTLKLCKASGQWMTIDAVTYQQ